MEFTLGFIICAIVLIIFTMLILRNGSLSEGFTDQKSHVPRIIWSYWSSHDLPETVKLCMKSWQKYNPNYEIRMMHKDTYAQYVTTLPNEIANHPNFNDCPQHFADLVRIYAIAEHGGVWCDASILMYESLDNILPQNFDYELFAYFVRPKISIYPVIENWFFAAPPGSEFVRRWRDEFTRVKDFRSPYAYTLSLIYNDGVIPNFGNPLNIKQWGYLAMHMSAQKILQKDKYPLDKIVLQDATQGPLKYNAYWGIDLFAESSIEYACKNPAIRYPMMKLTRHQRPAFEKFRDCAECKWV